MNRKRKVKCFLFVVIAVYLLLFPALIYPQESNGKAKKTAQGQNQVKNQKNLEEGKTLQDTKDNNTPAYQYKAPTFGSSKTSYPMLILRTVAVLAIIVISIFVLFRILVKNKNKIISDSEIIKILATFPLATNRIIQIVDIGGKVLVLGVTDSNINLITTIEDKEVIDNIKLFYSKEKAEKTGFKDQFLKLLGGKVFTKTGQISYLDNYKKRIKKMRKL